MDDGVYAAICMTAGVAAPRAGAGSDLSPAILGAGVQEAERSLFPLVLRPAHREQEPGRRVALSGTLKRIDGHPEFGDSTGLLFDLQSDPGEGQNLRSQRPGEWKPPVGGTGRPALLCVVGSQWRLFRQWHVVRPCTGPGRRRDRHP